MNTAITWQWQDFTKLSAEELYAILHLREQVFQLEQECLYPDIDNQDAQFKHLSGYHDGELAAYARMGLFDDQVVIGRIVVAPIWRGKDVGRQLLVKILDVVQATWPGKSVWMSAQEGLQSYYAKHGFVSVGEPYDEDGIMHIRMELR